ncbi:peroxiredoxin family protein [Silvibacterium sp.]|uniref:peroxiredoxin family protein n=1 Tax=Silvibacterium sp. TaxID=1964179 RepID=UPI0039E486F7
MTRIASRWFSSLIFLAAAGTAAAQTTDGQWDATVNVNGVVIPFRLDIAGVGSALAGTLYNGDQKETTTGAEIVNGSLVLSFDHYLTTIRATPRDGRLEGKVEGRFEAEKYLSDYPFEAKPHVEQQDTVGNAPSIAGDWIVPYDSAKGEKAWRLIVRQEGTEVSAAILRVDGDTGALTGRWHSGGFLLSHFDGSRPLNATVQPQPDGTLSIQLQGPFSPTEKLTAYRQDVALARGLPQPSDYTTHTSVRDPREVFAFSFPDVNGKTVSNSDPQFHDKVVLAIVTGTWCPNCHDEAQYLVQLYRKYHDKGLEIVALDFEEPEQQDSLKRERAFVKQYGVQYTYLIAGAPSEMWEKVPQAVNLNTWPATFFIGRDGRVKHIHAGFAAPASGDFNAQLQAEFTQNIEKLLSETPDVTTADLARPLDIESLP